MEFGRRKKEKGNLNSENINQLYSLYLLPSTIYLMPYTLRSIPFLPATRNPQPETRNSQLKPASTSCAFLHRFHKHIDTYIYYVDK